jgi:hypothetical protein
VLTSAFSTAAAVTAPKGATGVMQKSRTMVGLKAVDSGIKKEKKVDGNSGRVSTVSASWILPRGVLSSAA